ncbi:MAG: HAD hydrolase-like protein [Eubacterium sp.]|nr:HAD hydrolase-like protein [Eubacterium sp.]
MDKTWEQFCRKKEFLVCVDSDGCAMNSMDVKHIRCFGPCMVEEWGLDRWKAPILERWNEINLYRMTRGINRFRGLAKALREIDTKYEKIEGIGDLERWVEQTKELSNTALSGAIQERDSICLKKALSWSEKVNKRVHDLPSELGRPFEGVKEALCRARDMADVAVVSSANPQALDEEWNRYGVMEYVDVLLAQDMGSKAHCIKELLKKGYESSHALMIGDALGDYEAAEKNGIFFYPILVKKEEHSWEECRQIALHRLQEGNYGGNYQEQVLKEFRENLK